MMHLVEVALDAPVPRLLTYLVPAELQEQSLVGRRVLAPLGKRTVTGLVISEARPAEAPERELKPIREVLDPEPVLAPDMIELTRWMGEFYHCPWGRAIRTALPLGPGPASFILVRPLPVEGGKEAATVTPAMQEVLELLEREGAMPLGRIRRTLGRPSTTTLVRRLEELGRVETESRVTRRPMREARRSRLVLAVSPAEAGEAAEEIRRRAPRQAALLDRLLEQESLTPDPRHRSSVQTLIRRGLIRSEEVAIRRDPSSGIELDRTPPPELTPEQAAAFEAILPALRAPRAETFLLHGVTGSGKTEVYLRLMEEVLRQGRQAICLVPEISLTPQAVARFRGRLGDRVGVLHSAMSRGQARDEWVRLQRGEAAVALGPRSALFAPLRSIGLVVLDEEHDGSYKQDEEPLYHARTTAMIRAKQHGAPVLLGSATPSLESYQAALTGRIRLLELSRRVLKRPLPPVRVVDMRALAVRERPILVSTALEEAIQSALDQGGQCLILYNRRGFSTLLICPGCKSLVSCPHCSISMVYHRSQQRVRCHYCGHHADPPRRCPECQEEMVRYSGAGVQRLEAELAEGFPEARVRRLDSDVASRRGMQARILQEFGRREIDILVGTQMIAKGHDFPGVRLVGVVAADMGLGLPDFRSTERTFALITQVAGRAGRGDHPGEVLVQALQPDHFSVQHACRHDYRSFYEQESEMRRRLSLPPFARLALITVRAEERTPAWSTAGELKQRLARIAGERSRVYGPGPAPVPKVRDEYRFQVLVKARTIRDLQATLTEGLEGWRRPGGKVTVRVDVDPLNLW